MEIKKTRRKRKMNTRDFFIESIAIYSSIFLVTVIVQGFIIQLELYLLGICLLKSLITTIVNTLAVMYGRQITIVKKHWFIGTLVYTICSLPYVELTMLYLYQEDISLSLKMFISYVVIYFIFGLFIKRYLKFTKNVINKIFERGGSWFPFFSNSKNMDWQMIPNMYSIEYIYLIKISNA